MGLSVLPYLIDLHQLQAVYGSKDLALLRAEMAFADRIAEDQARYEAVTGRLGEANHAEHEPRQPALHHALQSVVEGVIRPDIDGWRYGYALELLCAYLGTLLPWEHFDNFSMFPDEFTSGAELDVWRPPLPIPQRYDSPSITYLTNAEAAAKLAGLSPVDLVAPYEWPSREEWASWDWQTIEVWEKEWGKRLQRQYRSWLEEAVRTGKGIVTFMY